MINSDSDDDQRFHTPASVCSNRNQIEGLSSIGRQRKSDYNAETIMIYNKKTTGKPA
jgi:hypothetical protein